MCFRATDDDPRISCDGTRPPRLSEQVEEEEAGIVAGKLKLVRPNLEGLRGGRGGGARGHGRARSEGRGLAVAARFRECRDGAAGNRVRQPQSSVGERILKGYACAAKIAITSTRVFFTLHCNYSTTVILIFLRVK